MKRWQIFLLGGIALVVIGGIAIAAYVLREVEDPSGPVTAIPVSETESGGPGAFVIVQEESQASFTIGEVLNGAPNTVVGITDQVYGEIAIHVGDPTATQVGVIQINARTLVTDSGMRNRAINNAILQTDQYEFITFAPSAIIGLPDSVAVGDTFSFQIVGDLTVRDVTHEVTFDVTVTAVSETRIEVTATATILYPDFGITIPQVPSVAGVDEEVLLELSFVAVAEG